MPDNRSFSDLEKRLMAEAEEAERRAIEAIRTGKRSAAIKYTVMSLTGNEEMASVDVFGRNGHHSVVMPTEKARQFVQLTDDAHRHVDIILNAYLANDPEQAVKYVRQLFTTLKKARRLGRPPLAEGETRAEQVTRYLEQHGLEATMAHFGLLAGTVVRYQGRANEKRGQ